MEHWGLAAIIPLNAALLAAAAGFALMLPDGTGPVQQGDPGLRFSLSALLSIPGFGLLMSIAGLIGGRHAMYDGFEVIRWHEAGMSAGTVSLLWSSSVLAEVPVFAVLGPALLRRMGPAACLVLATGAGIIRWGAPRAPPASR